MNIRPAARLTGLLAALIAAAALGVSHDTQAQASLRSLFRFEADVQVEPHAGLVRLELPEEVYSECQPDLSDLRIVDGEGRAQPYAVVRGDAAATHTRTLSPTPGKVLDAQREQEDGTPPTIHETYEVATPETDLPLVLRFITTQRDYTRNVIVSHIGSGGTRVIMEASVFRTTSAESTTLELGVLGSGRVRLEIWGRGAALDPRFVWSSGALPETTARWVDMTVSARDANAGVTQLTLQRPAGVLPAVLRFHTDTVALSRGVQVFDAGPNGRLGLVGSAVIKRTPSTPEAFLDVAIGSVRGDRLELEIVDRDSIELSNLRVSARVEAPTLIFEAQSIAKGNASPALLFGGATTRAPQYDLSAALGGDGAPQPSQLSAMPRASVASRRPNPEFQPEASFGSQIAPSAVLDTRSYRWQRVVDLPRSPNGIYRLTLTPEDLAVMRSDLADLRMVDHERRQRAYVIDPDGEHHEEVLLASTHSDPLTHVSTYSFTLAKGAFDLSAITFHINNERYDRAYELRVGADAKVAADVSVAQGRLRRAVNEDDSVLRMAWLPRRVARIDLIVSDADDAPLAIGDARAYGTVPVVFFGANTPRVTVLLGDRDASHAQYDLASAAETLMAVSSVTVVPGPLEANAAGERFAALRPMQRPGGVVPIEQFSHVRQLWVGETLDGVTRVVLEPEDLAIARADLADVRIVDAEHRQWPYLLATSSETRDVRLNIRAREDREGKSVVRLDLPTKPLPVVALQLNTPETFFDRAFEVVATVADAARDRETTLARGRLSRRPDETRDPIVIELPNARVTELALLIEDGSDAPLTLDVVSAAVKLPTLYLVAPAGKYAVLLGNSHMAQPRYELERVRDVVLSGSAEDGRLGTLTVSAARDFGAQLKSAATQEGLLWLALASALAVLTALTFRLLRREAPPDVR